MVDYGPDPNRTLNQGPELPLPYHVSERELDLTSENSVSNLNFLLITLVAAISLGGCVAK